MTEIRLFPQVGTFAENKDLARKIRLEQISPAIEKDDDVILDFSGVDATTQSFIHALISSLIRDQGEQILDKISFKNCNQNVKEIISTVVDYMQI